MSSTKSIDKEFIHDLAELLSKTDLTEIEVESGGFRVKVARQVTVQNVTATVAQPVAVQATSVAVASAPVSEKPDMSNAVPSPMVGTVYLAANPESPSFVQVGSTVSEGQTLLIVEAMKVMNNIPSPRAGVVKQILVSDKSPVEYGQPLMIIE